MISEIKKIDSIFFKKHSDEIFECILELKKHNEDESKIVLDNIASYLADNTAIIYCYLIDNTVVGFIWGYYINNNKIHINYFVVLKRFRSNGIGNKLLGKILKEYDKNNFELLVYKNNYPAISLYEKRGFTVRKYNGEKYKMILECL